MTPQKNVPILLSRYAQLSSSAKGFRTFLEMKSNAPKTVFASLNALENYLKDEML